MGFHEWYFLLMQTNDISKQPPWYIPTFPVISRWKNSVFLKMVIFPPGTLFSHEREREYDCVNAASSWGCISSWLGVYTRTWKKWQQFVLYQCTAAFCLLENEYHQMFKLLLKSVGKQCNSYERQLIVHIERGCHQRHSTMHDTSITHVITDHKYLSHRLTEQ